MNKIYLLFLIMLIAPGLNAQWELLNDVPFVTHHTNGFGHEGKAYIIQGTPIDYNGERKNTLWEYDPANDEWTALGPVPGSDRDFAIGDDMDGKYYFGFGTGMNDMWEYDPSSNEFTELPACPCQGRAHPAFVAHNNKIFMGTGSGGNGDLDDWWVFDFATQTWEQMPDMPGTRRHHPYQFGIGDYIYVGGGHRDNWLRWDINAESWSAIDGFPEGRVAGTQFSYKDKGYVLSGDLFTHEPLLDKEFLIYFPDSDEWHELPFEDSMHRWACSSFIIDNVLYFFGGLNYADNDSNSKMWRFDLDQSLCLVPGRLFENNLTENTAEIFWTESPAGDVNLLQWREKGETVWIEIENPETNYKLEDLRSCTEYEYRISVNCGDDGQIFSETLSFMTKGCGSCIDLTFCEVSQDFNTENGYLNRVKIGDYVNVSGDNDGYASFFTSNEIEVGLGEGLEIEVEPSITTFPSTNYYCKIWIDLNADGEFSDEEEVFNESNLSGTLVRTIQIPENGVEDLSKLRIMFNLNSPIIGPCGLSGLLIDGEVEDYCINLSRSTSNSNFAEADFSINMVYPNPFREELFVKKEITDYDIQLVRLQDFTGKLISEFPVEQLSENENYKLPLQNLESGIYFLQFLNSKNEILFKDKIIRF